MVKIKIRAKHILNARPAYPKIKDLSDNNVAKLINILLDTIELRIYNDNGYIAELTLLNDISTLYPQFNNYIKISLLEVIKNRDSSEYQLS